MKVSNIFLAISLAVSAAPAYAGGSMAPEVRIIVVNPSGTIRRFDEQRARRKAAERADRAAEKSAERSDRAAEKSRSDADKAYVKKLTAQRKAAAKKRK